VDPSDTVGGRVMGEKHPNRSDKKESTRGTHNNDSSGNRWEENGAGNSVWEIKASYLQAANTQMVFGQTSQKGNGK